MSAQQITKRPLKKNHTATHVRKTLDRRWLMGTIN